MNNFIKFLSSSQRFQDFAGVARGTYKVLAGINPIDISSPILKNEIHKNLHINLKEQSDEMNQKNNNKNLNKEPEKEQNIKMTEKINNPQNTKSFYVDKNFSNKNINTNKTEQHNVNQILDNPTKIKLEHENIKNEKPSNMRQSIDNTANQTAKNENFPTSVSDLNKTETISTSNRDLSESEKNKKSENADLDNHKSKPGSSNIDLVAKEQLKEKKIPATAFSRALSFGQLGLSVLGGGVAEAIKQNLV